MLILAGWINPCGEENEAARKGRQFSDFLELLYFAEREVKLFLKGHSRIIQMTNLDDGILKITKCQVIYDYGKKNLWAARLNPRTSRLRTVPPSV